MTPLVFAAGLATAADCVPLDDAGIRGQVDAAKAAIDRDDLVAFAEARRRLYHDLPCFERALPVDAWARFLLDEAVVAYALGEPWEAPLATALSLDDDLPRGDLPEALRDWVPGATTVLPATAVRPGEFLLDGMPVIAVPELAGVHVAQRRVGDRYVTQLLKGTPFPEDWLAPVPLSTLSTPVGPVARRKSPALLVTGLALAVGGAATGVGTWAARGGVTDPTAGQRLVAANVTGWGVATVGLAVSGIGLLPGTAVQGRF